MPVTILSSAHIVSTSGLDSFTIQAQSGAVEALTTCIAGGGVDIAEKIRQSGDVDISTDLVQLGGINKSEKIVNPSFVESTASVNFILFEPDFSRSQNLFAVIGSSGTAEKFFDRSPFFFTPSEVDPNTLRDLSEAQQFLIYTQTTIQSFDTFNHTNSAAHVISVKGTEFSSDFLSSDNLIINGSFESDFGSWSTTIPDGTLSVITEGGAGFLALSAPDGDKYTRVVKSVSGGGNANLIRLQQTITLTTPIASSLLNRFSFSEATEFSPSANFKVAVILKFLKNSSTVHVHTYSFSGMGQPSSTSLPLDLRFPTTDSLMLGTFSVGSFATFTSQIYQDMDLASFTFDELQINFFWGAQGGSTNLSMLLDKVELTANLPEDHLLRTSAAAHLLTFHPTASGFPFTISGSEDITITDEMVPFFDEESPVRNSSFNDPTNLNLSFHVKDAHSSVDQGSISVYINGLQVVTAGAGTTSATWPIVSKTVLTPRDIRYDLVRGSPFAQQATVTVSGNFIDLASPPNGAAEEYSFLMLGSGTLRATISGAADADPPDILLLYPDDLQTQVSPNTEIRWRLTDNAAGVDPQSVKLFLDGQLVLNNDVAVVGSFSRASNGAGLGFDYTYIPANPFIFGQTVTGTIQASDLATIPNSDTRTYSFTITPAGTLDIINFFLDDEESTLLTSGTYGSVEVVDLTYGVASGTTTLLINGSVPPGLLTTYSGAGPDRIIFTWPLENLVDFREDLIVEVHAENNFPGPYRVIKEAEYVLRSGYEVFWPNKNPVEEPPAEQVFPYLTNVFVNTEVKNFAVNFSTGSDFFRFRTEEQAKKDLGASLESNIKVADLSAFLNVLSPYFEYGKTMTLELEVKDLVGNQLSFTHIFTIEDSP